MAKLRLGMTVSLDGFACDSNRDTGMLYTDLPQLRNTPYMQDEINDYGAVLMGRHAYDMARGDLTGYEFQVPIFVLTHIERDFARFYIIQKSVLILTCAMQVAW